MDGSDDEYSMGTSESVDTEDSVSAQSVTHDVVAKPKDLPNAKKMSYWNDSAFPHGRVGRGVVHVFNNYTFTIKENNFENGYVDGANVRKVFASMSYKVRVWKNLTKKQTEETFKKISETKGLSSEFSLIIYVLSHGSDESTFFSSDCKPMNLMKLMVQLRKDNCPAMKLMPTIVFGDFCRGDNLQRGTGSKPNKAVSIQSYGDKENFKNMKYVMSSNPGMVSLMNDSGESAFTSVLCKMLSESAYQKRTLDDQWFAELNQRLRKNRLPNTARYTFDPFPGPLFYEESFSFKYDFKKVASRAGRKHYPK